MNHELYPYIYAVLYLVVYVMTIFWGKRAEFGRVILLIYTIASASSIYFYCNSLYSNMKLQLIPYIYLFFTTIICICPFLFYGNIFKYKLSVSAKLDALLTFVSWVLGVMALWWFLECLKIVLTNDLSQVDFDRNYEGYDYTGVRITWLGRKLKFVILHTIDILVFLLYYQLWKKEKQKILIFVLLLGSLASPIDAFIGGKRFAVVLAMFRYLIFYFMFKSYLSKGIQNKIRVLFIVCGILGGCALFLITLSRYMSNEYSLDMMTWMTLYSGEGPLRFNLQAWDMTVHTEGDNTFSFVKDILGLNTKTNFTDKDLYWGRQHHLQYAVYYTFVGDIFFDFGVIGTFVLLATLSLCIYKTILNYRGQIGYILTIYAFGKLVIFGFTYNPYILHNSQIDLFILLLFAKILNLVGENKNQIRL